MTSTNVSPSMALPIHGSDLRGLYRLGVDATVGLVDLVEAMHHTIASRAGIVGPAQDLDLVGHGLEDDLARGDRLA